MRGEAMRLSPFFFLETPHPLSLSPPSGLTHLFVPFTLPSMDASPVRVRAARWPASILAGAFFALVLSSPSAADETLEGQVPSDLLGRLRGVLLGSAREKLICPGCPQEPALRVDPVTGQATEVPLP